MRGFGQIAERLRRYTAQIRSEDQRAVGSGIVWSADGLILTNSHVVPASGAHVDLWDGSRFNARLEARDGRRDLATLRIPADGLETVTPADSTSLRPGELVIAVGSPLGFIGALSTGVVHSIGPLPGMGKQQWIRADVRLAPGNSGGPLANAKGEVIGINTAIVSGLAVALPVATAADFVHHGGRPALGVTLRPLRHGLMILEVASGGAAEAASLRTGDILLCSLDELNDALDSGEGVMRIRFLRGDRSQVREVAVRVAARAEAA